MGTIDDRNVIIQPLNKFWYGNKVAALDMLRLDLLHPIISGNKWYKLRLNLAHAMDNGLKTVVTFGGGYSNHLIATACAARIFKIRSVGIVRGKYDQLTPTLEACRREGMELIFVTKEDYENKHQPDWARELVSHFDELFIIPEGGANEWGRTGAGLITRFITAGYSHIALAVGSGTTLIGLRNKLSDHQQVLGFVPMKDGAYLAGYINEHLSEQKKGKFKLFDNWHFGGFGKWNNEQIGFMNEFYNENKVPLDIVYTSKMMYGIRDLLEQNYFSSCDKILCIHSGGLQGNVSVQDKLAYRAV
jgi:1-aminocyclopropane-1-carboxylate deaminase